MRTSIYIDSVWNHMRENIWYLIWHYDNLREQNIYIIQFGITVDNKITCTETPTS